MILVSMCLLEVNCNYKGECKPNEKVIELVKKGKAIPFCPEQLGGLPTPRSGARILSSDGKDVIDGKSRVITDDGQDVTRNYLDGANEILKIINLFGIRAAILKQGSPSCGKGLTQGGKLRRETAAGIGVTSALLERQGIRVFTDEELDSNWDEIKKHI